MKRLLTALLIMCMSISLFFVVGCIDEETDDRPVMNIDYITQKDGTKAKVYNGTAQEFFNVTEEKSQVVKVTVQKLSGELNIKIFKENDESFVVYEGRYFPATTFTVNVTDVGRYVILVVCDDFVGEYDFEYDLSA